MSQTQYQFRVAIAGFFEIPTEDARRLLPARFSPMEVNYGRSILMVNLYDFTESPVGAYREMVYGIMVPPNISDGILPAGAVFPWQVATTTAVARQHATERWHLPHWPEDIQIDFDENRESIRGTVHIGEEEVLSLEVSARQWKTDPQLYQTFMHNTEGTFTTRILYEGQKSEHEKGTGLLTLDPNHPFNARLKNTEFDELAFREIWQQGTQTFDPLQKLA